MGKECAIMEIETGAEISPVLRPAEDLLTFDLVSSILSFLFNVELVYIVLKSSYRLHRALERKDARIRQAELSFFLRSWLVFCVLLTLSSILYDYLYWSIFFQLMRLALFYYIGIPNTRCGPWYDRYLRPVLHRTEPHFDRINWTMRRAVIHIQDSLWLASISESVSLFLRDALADSPPVSTQSRSVDLDRKTVSLFRSELIKDPQLAQSVIADPALAPASTYPTSQPSSSFLQEWSPLSLLGRLVHLRSVSAACLRSPTSFTSHANEDEQEATGTPADANVSHTHAHVGRISALLTRTSGHEQAHSWQGGDAATRHVTPAQDASLDSREEISQNPYRALHSLRQALKEQKKVMSSQKSRFSKNLSK
eukprot:TRINITY_DN19279_c0_g1::TRINITY_DN19279_c0_g1_i1::g.15869::m.15869 TRINITY_DN19279_c0_g1::TRINITY_DN19279_c0_g1_i1::g.15869  ORF type:complete len:367 (-),score=9.04,TB2_DP1_HVA22/PF03134.14/0.0001,Init_tRNA_PT/PF04179.7/0.065,Grp1_Fun34_YaaH/PF01184.14/0.093 TRINITY_DN19279_c0_g1_i1:293-1393(-)